MGKKKTTMRLTVDLTPAFYERLERLEEISEAGTKAALIRQALQVYEFLIERTLAGYSFEASKGDDRETLVFPGTIAAKCEECHDPLTDALQRSGMLLWLGATDDCPKGFQATVPTPQERMQGLLCGCGAPAVAIIGTTRICGSPSCVVIGPTRDLS